MPNTLKRILQTEGEYGELEVLTNSEEEELGKLAAAFEDLLEILAYPRINRNDFTSDC